MRKQNKKLFDDYHKIQDKIIKKKYNFFAQHAAWKK